MYLERDPAGRAEETSMPDARDLLLDPRLPGNHPYTNSVLSGLWGALLQAFTVEETVQRKIK